jgi:hypothetical protein
MNFARYPALKSRGLVSLRKTGSAFAADITQFDRETGERSISIESLDKTLISAHLTSLQKQTDGTKLLLDDLNTIP